MYTPSLPPPRNENPPTTTHLHPKNETLSEHEDSTLFQMYLNGRHSAYSAALRDARIALATSQETQQRYPRASGFWTVLEGQIEATKEIIEYLTKLQKEAP